MVGDTKTVFTTNTVLGCCGCCHHTHRIVSAAAGVIFVSKVLLRSPPLSLYPTIFDLQARKHPIFVFKFQNFWQFSKQYMAVHLPLQERSVATGWLRSYRRLRRPKRQSTATCHRLMLRRQRRNRFGDLLPGVIWWWSWWKLIKNMKNNWTQIFLQHTKVVA